MRPESPFILLICSLIIGTLGAILWFFIGTFFISAFIAGFMEGFTDEVVNAGPGNVIPAFLITLTQNIVTLILLVVAFMRTFKHRPMDSLKSDAIIVLVLGIAVLIVNPLQALTSIVVIIAGALMMKAANEHVYRVTIEKKELDE